MIRPAALATVALLSLAAVAAADVIWTGTGAGRGLAQEVDVQGAEGDALVYLINGNRATKPLAEVKQIQLDDDAELTAAEAAYAAGEWGRAADGYEALVRPGQPDWIRRRAAGRLATSAGRAGSFQQAAAGYVALVGIDPAAAADNVPEVSAQSAPDALAAARAEVEQALAGGSLNEDQRQALLTFQLRLANAAGDAEAAGRIVQQLGTAMGGTAPNDEAGRRLFAQIQLGKAQLALDGGDPETAAAAINDHGGVFEQPEAQQRALMLLARVEEAQADAAGGGQDALLDAALAYMKVVALFGDDPRAGEVPEALLRVGLIHERLGLADDAAAVYRDLVQNHAQSAAAVEAQRRLEAVAPADPSPAAG